MCSRCSAVRLPVLALLIILVAILAASAEAQEHLDRGDQFLTFSLENDLFGSGRDKHYTSGARLSYYDPNAKVPDFIGALERILPFFHADASSNVYYSLGQSIYTPENIVTRTPDPADRPYAGFLYGAVGIRTGMEGHVDEWELTLGVVGPWAFGEEVQKAIHDLIDAYDPAGWDAQLENEPAFSMAFQRAWPAAMTEDFASWFLRLEPQLGASLGNLYTHAHTGVILQLMPARHKWQAAPLRVRPAIPGGGAFAVPQERFAWSLFAGVEGRAVGRNIFLDGNTFEGGPGVEKKALVVDVSGGLSLNYGRVQVAYVLNWRSDEFVGQGGNNLFGAISVGYRL